MEPESAGPSAGQEGRPHQKLTCQHQGQEERPHQKLPVSTQTLTSSLHRREKKMPAMQPAPSV